MTDVVIANWLIAVGAFELLAILVFTMFVIDGKSLKLHWVLKLGLIAMALGLAVQLIRTAHYLQHGFYPVDHFVPAWALKDIGGSLILYYFAFIWPNERGKL